MEESTCHKKVIWLFKRFSCMKYLFFAFYISFKHDYHVDAENIRISREMSIISTNIFDFTAWKLFRREDLSIFIYQMINY